jgi:uncharacterized coiled-coil protein SlyX
VQDIKQAEYEVRLAAANKRIDELERKVGALEVTPEKLDLDLLTQRVTALEVNAGDAVVQVPMIAPAAAKVRSGGNAPRAGGEAGRRPAGVPKLNLPDLENRPRPATPSEVKAFSSKPNG